MKTLPPCDHDECPLTRCIQNANAKGVGIGDGLGDISRQYALEQYKTWRDSIAAADRADLEALVMVMIQKRAVDGMNGRRWDAGGHLYFELATVSMLQKIKSPNDKVSAPRQ